MIIGVSGKARSGKDCIANILQEKCGFKIMHFHDALYEECRHIQNYIQFLDCTKRAFNGEIIIDHNSEALITNADHTTHKRQVPDDIPIELLRNGMVKKHGRLLQWWGTEVRRAQNKDYWVKLLVSRVVKENPITNIVIPDIRFKNEALAVKSLGGILLKVERTWAGIPYVDASRDPSHLSEVELDQFEGWDIVINNDRSLKSLKKKLKKILRSTVSQVERSDNDCIT